ncbi:MAG: hypothetical protein Q4A74_06905 [Cardiobacteriaceae bacterium]|nr:hypothetical protein [Cardiobacteriaceae bacterium]
MPRKTVFAAALTLAATQATFAADDIQETVSNDSDRESVALTIYNDELALIRETRKLNLNAGLNRIALRDVSARIMPQTVSLQTRSGEALQLLEQNFDYDLLNSTSLLDKYIGKRVIVIRTNPTSGEETREEATVLANNSAKSEDIEYANNNSSVTLQYADRIESGLPANARLAFPELPTNLRDRPSLIVDLNAEKAGTESVNLAYLSKGF